jgi:hypothetical protein
MPLDTVDRLLPGYQKAAESLLNLALAGKKRDRELRSGGLLQMCNLLPDRFLHLASWRLAGAHGGKNWT